MRAYRLYLRLFLVSCLILGAMVLGLRKDPGPYARAVAWATKNPDRLPSTLDELAAFPASWRFGIYSTLDPQIKNALWHEQLSRLLTENPGMSVKQRAFVDSMLDKMAPVTFSKDATPLKICEDVHNLFGGTGMEQAFKAANIGLLGRPSQSVSTIALDTLESVRQLMVVNALSDCTANSDSYWQCLCNCEVERNRRCDNGNCNVVSNCGCITSYNCNARCDQF
jgi:hypothetical protein